jgi:hypothetical protein
LDIDIIQKERIISIWGKDTEFYLDHVEYEAAHSGRMPQKKLKKQD